jgi:hypothetical protein
MKMANEPGMYLFGRLRRSREQSETMPALSKVEIGTYPLVKSYLRGPLSAMACGPRVG